MDQEIGVFQNVAQHMKLPLEFQCETGLLLRCDGKVGIPFQTKQGNCPHVEIRRGEGAQIMLCQETRCSSRVRPVCRAKSWVASRVSSSVSNLKREQGISLETLQQEGASSHDDPGTSWFFSSCSRILEL